MHWKRWQSNGDPSITQSNPLPDECVIEDCDRKPAARGMCHKHWQRWKKHGDPHFVAERSVAPVGTVTTDKDGYKHLKTAEGWKPEHRWVIEQKLGRELIPGENVHHKNGVRDDNRLENLELWVRQQPAGQRVKDLVEWAKEILDRYGEISW